MALSHSIYPSYLVLAYRNFWSFVVITNYLCIVHRCAIDETVNFIPSADERTQRFSLEAFKFLGDHQFVYMHCKVKICNATDPNSRCAQGCLHDRRRRSLYTQETNDEEYTLAQGPFMRKGDDEDSQLQETEKDLRAVENKGPLKMLIDLTD